MQRFMKVNDMLFRGGAPSIEEVQKLHDKFGINKIISLDLISGNRIDRVCKLLNIKHIIIPIDFKSIEPIAKLLSYNLYDFLIKGGPTFVHCLEGKDRTGMVIAMFRCKCLGWSFEKAITEAKKIGFGIGLESSVINLYEKIIRMSCNKNKDNNSADIVGNERDEAEVVIDNADMKSFAPYLDISRDYPYNNIDLQQEQISSNKNFPLVGLRDNIEEIGGTGFVDTDGGLLNILKV